MCGWYTSYWNAILFYRCPCVHTGVWSLGGMVLGGVILRGCVVLGVVLRDVIHVGCVVFRDVVNVGCAVFRDVVLGGENQETRKTVVRILLECFLVYFLI